MARALWLGVMGLLLLVLGGSPTVRAESLDGGLRGDARIFPLSVLGSPGPMDLYGDRGIYTLTVPVPDGLLPRSLEAAVQVPPFVRAGVISVLQDGNQIAEVGLPPDRRLVLPLSGARVGDAALTVTLRAALLPEPGYCLDPSVPLRITDASITFDGIEIMPRALADFLPPVLRKLTIALPLRPSVAESDAAVRLAGAVVARYGAQNPAVAVVALDAESVAAWPAPTELERRVVITEDGPGGLTMEPGSQPPLLRISGSPAELVNQTRLLASAISGIAQSSQAVAGPISPSPVLPADSMTLRDLGLTDITAVALAPQVTIPLDQTRLGRSAREVKVYALGAYTPLPSGMSGQLVAEVGGEVVDRWPADDTGRIRRTIAIPDRLLRRDNGLVLRLDTAGPIGACGEFQPLTLTIDAASAADSSRAAPPVPDGLQSVPQSLMPRFLVGVDTGDLFPDAVRAVDVMVALQRISVRPLDAVVVGIEQALDSGQPAVLIAAAGWRYPETVLPVNLGADTVRVEAAEPDGTTTEVTLTPGLPVAMIQVAFDGRRTLMVAATNGHPDRLDDLLRWLAVDPLRLSRAEGTALMAVPGRAPVTIADRSAVTGSPPRTGVVWVLAGVAGVAAAIGVGVITVRNRGVVRPLRKGQRLRRSR